MAFDIMDDIAEVWQPSVQLRFVERVLRPEDREGVKVLQQLWTSDKGKRKWEDVPIVKG